MIKIAQIIIGPTGVKANVTLVTGNGALDVNVTKAVSGTTPANTDATSKAITVTTAGTRVALALGSTKKITVRADDTNTGLIYLGDVTVAAANGYRLTPGESTECITVDDTTAALYVDSSVNGEGATVIYEN